MAGYGTSSDPHGPERPDAVGPARRAVHSFVSVVVLALPRDITSGGQLETATGVVRAAEDKATAIEVPGCVAVVDGGTD